MVGLCERFHCLPSQLYQEDAEFLRMLEIVRMGTKQEPEYDEEGFEE